MRCVSVFIAGLVRISFFDEIVFCFIAGLVGKPIRLFSNYGLWELRGGNHGEKSDYRLV